MKKSLFPAATLSALSLLLLLLKPEIALAGARDGLNLWAFVVLPTLLPFMLCSTAAAQSGGISLLTAPFSPLLEGVFGLSEAGSYTLLTGLLCGYPMGARTCARFRAQGLLSAPEAKVLLAVSNHPSPMFLLGYVMAGLDSLCPAALFLAAVYLPILPIAILAAKIYRFSPSSAGSKRSPHPSETPGFSFGRDFLDCLEAMEKIGGCILVFSILAAYIWNLSPLPPAANACLLGLTEITTGIHALKAELGGPLLAAAAAAASAFGGLSGVFQTQSVLTKNAGLSIRHYVLWKLIHAGLTGLILTAALLP